MANHSDKQKSRKPTLAGKTVFVVEVGTAGTSIPQHTNCHRDDMQKQGATVIYARANQGGELQYQVEGIKAELAAMARKPDVLFIHHPRMNMHDGDFASNPAMQLARTAKEMGIPTLIQDLYQGLEEADRQVMRSNGATFRNLEEFYDKITPVVASLANNKEKLTGVGGSAPQP